MDLSVFEYRDYRAYLLNVFGGKNQRRGLKSQAAKFLGCHSTLISQILHGHVELTLEQADKLNGFLGHTEEECDFFLLLVQRARAGTRSLQQHFLKQIEVMLKSRQQIKKRIGQSDTISKQDELRYYSSWQFAAIHVALSIPHLRNVESLANRLGLSEANVLEALSFLTKSGLAIRKSKGEFEIGPKYIHLSSDSPLVTNHHRNWRVKAIQSLDMAEKDDVHYSSAVTLSREDVYKIKEMLIENLKNMNQTIRDSKEEEIYGLNFDFFRLA